MTSCTILGLSTALYATKTKFSLFADSWNAENGAADVTGVDNGTSKLDHVFITETDQDAGPMINGDGMDIAGFAADLNAQMFNYSFVHIADPDRAGHDSGWGTPAWLGAVTAADSYLGSIFNSIDNNPLLADSTAIVVTSDHGGVSTGHGRSSQAENYTVPIFTWGSGIAAGADLYSRYPTTRLNPGDGRPDYNVEIPPLRNGDTGNLALELLGLDPIPGSLMIPSQTPPPANLEGLDSVHAEVKHIYELNGNVTDSLGGPDMVLTDPSKLTDSGYEFARNKGATLSDAIHPTNYSIELRLEFKGTPQGLLLDYKNLEKLNEGLEVPGFGRLPGLGGLATLQGYCLESNTRQRRRPHVDRQLDSSSGCHTLRRKRRVLDLPRRSGTAVPRRL